MTVVDRVEAEQSGKEAGNRIRAKVPRWPRPNLRGLAFAVLLLAAIELLTRTVVQSIYVPRPSEAFLSLVDLGADGELLPAVGSTMRTFVLSLTLATVAGAVLGALIGASKILFQSVRLVIEFLRPLPSVALIPLVTLIYGVGTTTSVLIATYAAFWPILFNTYYGVRDAHPDSTDTARTFGLSRARILFRVSLPNAAPNVAVGIRVGAAIALILTITVEIVTSAGGLGYLIVRMQTATRSAEMYGTVFLVGLLGYVINLAIRGLERRAVYWTET